MSLMYTINNTMHEAAKKGLIASTIHMNPHTLYKLEEEVGGINPPSSYVGVTINTLFGQVQVMTNSWIEEDKIYFTDINGNRLTDKPIEQNSPKYDKFLEELEKL